DAQRRSGRGLGRRALRLPPPSRRGGEAPARGRRLPDRERDDRARARLAGGRSGREGEPRALRPRARRGLRAAGRRGAALLHARRRVVAARLLAPGPPAERRLPRAPAPRGRPRAAPLLAALLRARRRLDRRADALRSVEARRQRGALLVGAVGLLPPL